MTIVGPGGVGKSRLAVETARTIEDRYEDGACLAELASLDDPSLIVQALSRATDAAMDERDQSVESLIRNLADRQLLLLLDNCEHLIEDVAAVTEALVQHCPRLHVLATSREPLQVEGEALCRLAPLATPTLAAGITAAELAGSAAAVLFADRAALAEPSFVLDDRAAGAVADIVVALDGLPLALELAAASLRSVGLDAVVAGLSQPVPPLADRRTSQTRQRTMWATVDWSYQLLDDDLRLLLERLSVFAGSFTAAQAEAVCASGLEPGSVAPALAELADRSLVDHAMASRDDDPRRALPRAQHGARLRPRAPRRTTRRSHRSLPATVGRGNGARPRAGRGRRRRAGRARRPRRRPPQPARRAQHGEGRIGRRRRG